MKIKWIVESKDVLKAKKFLDRYYDNPFVQYRIHNTIENENPDLSIETFWLKNVACLLTSQQKSGPNSPVSNFIRMEPFPLGYDICINQEDLSTFVTNTLREFGGIRFVNNLGRFISENMARLQDGLWLLTGEILEGLKQDITPEGERRTADFIQKNYLGFGQKQARNLLQALGLARYEIPIDRRVVKWLNKFGFPLKFSTTDLQSKDYYSLVSDGIQALCAEMGIYPVVLDAAIFASFDIDPWTEENVIW